MRRTVLVGLTAGAMLLAACGNSTSTGEGAKQGEPINVGLIAPLTGAYSALGKGDREGAEVAVQQINAAGGIKGRKVNLIVKDDQTKPDQSVVAFDSLLSEGVVGVLGSSNSNAALAVAPLAQRQGIPYVSLSPSDELVQQRLHNVVTVPPTSRMWSERDLQWMAAEGIKKIAVVYAQDDAFHSNGQRSTADLAPKYGIEVVANESVETGATDFSPALTHIRRSGAEAIFLWIAGPGAVIFTKQWAASDLHDDVKLVMTGAQASSLYSEPAGDAAEGVIINGYAAVIGDHLPAGALKEKYQTLSDELQRRYNSEFAQFTGDAHAGAELLFAAMEQASSLAPEAVADSLTVCRC
ncbi:MAG: ABC transporter substrate-binding protein [Streptosporangiales bacterium]|nr:ABC transporter substrate-binding protein [Streptosporangiales bacterium]